MTASRQAREKTKQASKRQIAQIKQKTSLIKLDRERKQEVVHVSCVPVGREN